MSSAIKQSAPRLWQASPHVMPYSVARSGFYEGHIGIDVFETEKEAINAARKFRINHIDRLQAEVNTLDERYDAIEDEEMACRRDG